MKRALRSKKVREIGARPGSLVASHAALSEQALGRADEARLGASVYVERSWEFVTASLMTGGSIGRLNRLIDPRWYLAGTQVSGVVTWSIPRTNQSSVASKRSGWSHSPGARRSSRVELIVQWPTLPATSIANRVRNP